LNQLPKALAFTRNPSDTSVSPATYTADGASDLVLVDQKRDIAIDGSDKKDSILVNASALAADALYNYNIRGFAGNDTIRADAKLIQDSVINGNEGNDSMLLGSASANDSTQFSNSYFLGGKGSDNILAYDTNGGEVNGNIGNDVIVVDNFGDTGFNSYVGGGQGNDNITVRGNFTDSIIDGNKGIDTINVEAGTHSGTSINGGDGNDILRNVAGFDTKGLHISGDLGNDTIISVGGLGSKVFGGEGKDTIVSAAGLGETSSVDAGTGADFVTIANLGVASLARETIVFNEGDSVAAVGSKLGSVPGAAISGTIFFGNGVDQISSFTTGSDKIDIDFDPKGIVVGNTLANTANTFKDFIYEVQGTFTNNIFTTGTAAGDTDFLYMIGGPNVPFGASFTQSTNIIVSDKELFINDFV